MNADGSMTAKAFAVVDRTRLLADTVRSAEHAAREAAVKLLKQPGVGWRDLERAGYRVVAVQVAAAPPPPPRPSRKPADLVVAVARERLRMPPLRPELSGPDAVPIRRLLKGTQ
jgi:hypothetical protein